MNALRQIHNMRALRPQVSKNVNTPIIQSFHASRTYVIKPNITPRFTNTITGQSTAFVFSSRFLANNILTVIKKPTVVVQLLAAGGGILILAQEDVLSVGWKDVSFLEKKNGGVVLNVGGKKLDLRKEDGKWVVRVERK